MNAEDLGLERREFQVPLRRPWLRLVVRIGGSVMMLSALVAFVSPRELATAARRMSPGMMLPALIVYLLLHLLGSMKWRIMINAAGAGLSCLQSARCYYAGLFANTFLLSLVGGDVVRAGMAMRQARSKAGLLVGCLADRLFDVAGLLTITVASAFFIPGLLDRQSTRLCRALFLVAGVLVVAGAALGTLLPARRLPYKVRRHLVRFRVATHSVLRHPHLVFLAFGIGIVLQTSLVVMNAWLGDTCGLHLPIWCWLFAWPLAKIASMMPVSLGGLGVREAALVSLLVPLGADSATVAAAGLAFEAVIIMGGLLSGLITLLLSTKLMHYLADVTLGTGRVQVPSTVSES